MTLRWTLRWIVHVVLMAATMTGADAGVQLRRESNVGMPINNETLIACVICGHDIMLHRPEDDWPCDVCSCPGYSDGDVEFTERTCFQ